MEHDYTFDTARLRFRPFVIADVLALHQLEVEMSDGTEPLTEDELRLSLVEQIADDATLGFVGLHHGEFAVHARLRLERPPAGWTLGYSVTRHLRRRGYGSEAVRALTGFAQRELHCEEILARVEPGNTASIELLRSLGFEELASQHSPRWRLVFRWPEN